MWNFKMQIKIKIAIFSSFVKHGTFHDFKTNRAPIFAKITMAQVTLPSPFHGRISLSIIKFTQQNYTSAKKDPEISPFFIIVDINIISRFISFQLIHEHSLRDC